jgi:hypothetical protein
MTVVSPPQRSGAEREDVGLRAGRRLLLLSIFLSSVLVARVGEYTAGDLVLGAAVGVTLFSVAARTDSRQYRLPPLGAIMVLSLLVGGGALSGLRAQSVASTLAVVFRLVLVVIVLPWLMRVVLPDRQHLRSALTAFVAGCGLSGSGTLLQFAFGETIIPNTGVTNAGRFAGLTQNVSDTGGICCAGVVGAIALLATATGRRSRAIPLLALVGSVFGLVLSGSVSGLLSTAIGFVVLALSGVLRPRVVLGSIVAFAAVLALSVVIQTESGALNPVQRILQTTGQSADNRYNTAGSRLSTYTEALRKFIENPIIGSGLDPNSTIADGIYPAHNLFLAAAFEGGVLLAIGVLLAVLRAFRGGVLRRMRADPALATAVALVVTELVFAMTAPSLYNRYLWIPIALLLTTRIIAMPRPQPRPADVPDVRAAPVDKTIEFVLAGDPIGMRRRKRHS